MSAAGASRLAVLGHPVGHSRSPAMQNAALAALGLAPEWRYEAIDVASEGLAAKLAEMAAAGFVGANVTIPHKEAALAAADRATPAAQAIGAANTLSFSDGGIEADNTDAGGLLDALPPGAGEGRALVLGAGGAARAVVWALASGGANLGAEREPVAVDVWNRTAERAERVAAELGGTALGAARPVELGAYGLIVNTTAVGLRGEDPFADLPLAAEALGPGHVVVDMVYGERPSLLLEAAASAGATVVDGIEILVRQGARSLTIWTGREPPLATMRAAARAPGSPRA